MLKGGCDARPRVQHIARQVCALSSTKTKLKFSIYDSESSSLIPFRPQRKRKTVPKTYEKQPRERKHEFQIQKQGRQGTLTQPQPLIGLIFQKLLLLLCGCSSRSSSNMSASGRDHSRGYAPTYTSFLIRAGLI